MIQSYHTWVSQQTCRSPLVCCSVVQCVAVCSSTLRCGALWCVAVRLVRCSALQCVAVQCSALHTCSSPIAQRPPQRLTPFLNFRVHQRREPPRQPVICGARQLTSRRLERGEGALGGETHASIETTTSLTRPLKKTSEKDM